MVTRASEEGPGAEPPKVNEGERPKRLLDGLLGLMPLRLAIWIYAVTAILPGFLTDPYQLINYMDEHQFYNWEEADRISVVEHGQLPLWNPYYCGGMVSTAAPESGFFAPDYLLRLVFGVARGRHFALVLFVVLGMEGVYRICRTASGSAVSGIFAAVVFTTFNKLVHTYLGQGWVHFFGFELVPWVILGFIKGRESVPWRLIGAMALGWIVHAVGTYTAPYTGIAVIYLTVALGIASLARGKPRELIASLKCGATIGFGALGLGLVKLLPMMLVMRQYPRTFTPLETHEPISLLQGYWHPYAIVIVLALVALLFADFWARAFFGAAVLFFICAMGHFADWAPSMIMRKLPLLSGLRYPERFMVMFHLFAVLTAALGVSHLEDLVSKSLRWIWLTVRKPAVRKPLETLLVPVLVTAVASYAVVRFGRSELEPILASVHIKEHGLFTFEAPRPVVQPFAQARGNRRDAHIFPPANRGSLYCFVGIPLPESPLLRGDLAADEYPENPALATVERVKWTPQAITLKVEASAPARIFINQNYSPKWQTDVGQTVDVDRLLAIDVPRGSHVLTVRYRDWTTYLCLAISLATLIGMLVHLGKRARVLLRETYERYAAWGVPHALVALVKKKETKE